MDHRIPKMDRRHDVVGVLPPLGGNQLSVGDRPVDLLTGLGEKPGGSAAVEQHRGARGDRNRQLVLLGFEGNSRCRDSSASGVGQPQHRRVTDPRGQFECRLRLLGSFVELLGLGGLLLGRVEFCLGFSCRLLSRSVFHLGRLQLRRQVIGNLLGRIGRLLRIAPRFVGLVRLDLGRLLGLSQFLQLGSQFPVFLLDHREDFLRLGKQFLCHSDQQLKTATRFAAVGHHGEFCVGRLQVGNTVDAGSRLIHKQPPQCLDRLQVRQADVGHRGAKEVQRLQDRQFRNGLQTGIGDGRFREVEFFDGRHTGQVLQSRVGDGHTLEQHRGDVLQHRNVLQVIVGEPLDGKPQVHHDRLPLGRQAANTPSQLGDPRDRLVGRLDCPVCRNLGRL